MASSTTGGRWRIPALLLGCLLLLLSQCGRRDVAPAVSAAALRAIAPGQGRDEVLQRLGAPFGEQAYLGHVPGNTVLRYARAPFGACTYPLVDIVLQWDRVTAVYVREALWWGHDTRNVYMRSADVAVELEDLGRLLGPG